MRSLNINELSEVQGGGIAFRWAVRAGELIADAFTLFEAAQKVDYDPASYGRADSGGYNPMGDYTNGICVR
ncbi:MAG: hypothetical protein WCH92_03450 [Betaproteobacteria bacterium]|jgi:hypothetical protein